MVEMVSNVAFGAALLAGLLGFIEWLLPKSARHKLKDATAAIWMWLAEQNSHPYGRFLASPAAQVLLLALGLLPIGLAAFFLTQVMLQVGGGNQDFVAFVSTTMAVTILAALATAFLLRRLFGRLISWTVRGAMPIAWFVKALVISAGAFVVLCVPFLFYETLTTLVGTLPTGVGLALFVLVLFVYSLALVIFGGYCLMFLSVALYALAILILLGTFKVFALIFDRISSSEKGVIAGLVVALTVIGSIARAWKF
jgi:hypothetical protein